MLAIQSPIYRMLLLAGTIAEGCVGRSRRRQRIIAAQGGYALLQGGEEGMSPEDLRALKVIVFERHPFPAGAGTPENDCSQYVICNILCNILCVCYCLISTCLIHAKGCIRVYFGAVHVLLLEIKQ